MRAAKRAEGIALQPQGARLLIAVERARDDGHVFRADAIASEIPSLDGHLRVRHQARESPSTFDRLPLARNVIAEEKVSHASPTRCVLRGEWSFDGSAQRRDVVRTDHLFA